MQHCQTNPEDQGIQIKGLPRETDIQKWKLNPFILPPPDKGTMLDGMIFTYTRGKMEKKTKHEFKCCQPPFLLAPTVALFPLIWLPQLQELFPTLQEGHVLQKAKGSAKALEFHHPVHGQDQDRNHKKGQRQKVDWPKMEQRKRPGHR